MAALIEYRDAMIAGGQPAPYRTYRRHGRHIMDVFPKGHVIFLTLSKRVRSGNRMMSAVFGDMRFEVWIQEGKEPTQGAVYRAKASPSFKPNGRVALVLGSSDVTFAVCVR